MAESSGPILHVIVVGFHHKKGCQVEYSFPPLVSGAPNECPLGWKYLPTLALPDGSHNYDEDTVYFHLPSLNDPKRTIYGISCFRQIPVEKLKNRTSDITRGTVQKSVCVLSTLPLYGHIQVKMALITHAYFDEGDFSKVSLLEDTYHHLNSCMSGESQIPPQIFVGLSARDFILQFRHKVLLLFKLLLLEKRIVFYQSPVQPLCATILTLLSLYPDMIEHGLQQAACVRPSRPMSPIPTFDEEEISTNNVDDSNLSSTRIVKDNISNTSHEQCNDNSNRNSLCINDNKTMESMEGKCLDGLQHVTLQKNNNDNENLNMKVIEIESAQECTESYLEESNSKYSPKPNDNVHRVHSVNAITLSTGDTDNSLPRDTSSDALSDARLTNNITQIAHINPELCGLPLELFTKGYLCLPYLSLPYLDLLGDVNVRGYIVGATNVLFKQKKQLIDVLIEVENTRIEATDPELRRQLHLTTEDLRFADYVVRHVAEPRKDIFLDGVGWEGGDEWIRTQFRVYLLSMLRTSMQQDTRQSDHYNAAFMSAWRTTNNYKAWCGTNKPEIHNIESGHPFAGQLSVQDMKLRLSHTMQNTESGRKLNQAMASTGRAVATTGKAVEILGPGKSSWRFRSQFFNQKPQKFFTDGIMALLLLSTMFRHFSGRAMMPSVKNFCGFWLKNCDRKRHELFPGPNIILETNNLQGGALSQAKGAFSNWWSTLTTVQPVDEAKIDNQTTNNHHTVSSVTDKESVEDEEMNISTTNNVDLTVDLD